MNICVCARVYVQVFVYENVVVVNWNLRRNEDERQRMKRRNNGRREEERVQEITFTC